MTKGAENLLCVREPCSRWLFQHGDPSTWTAARVVRGAERLRQSLLSVHEERFSSPPELVASSCVSAGDELPDPLTWCCGRGSAHQRLRGLSRDIGREANRLSRDKWPSESHSWTGRSIRVATRRGAPTVPLFLLNDGLHLLQEVRSPVKVSPQLKVPQREGSGRGVSRGEFLLVSWCLGEGEESLQRVSEESHLVLTPPMTS